MCKNKNKSFLGMIVVWSKILEISWTKLHFFGPLSYSKIAINVFLIETLQICLLRHFPSSCLLTGWNYKLRWKITLVEIISQATVLPLFTAFHCSSQCYTIATSWHYFLQCFTVFHRFNRFPRFVTGFHYFVMYFFFLTIFQCISLFSPFIPVLCCT